MTQKLPNNVTVEEQNAAKPTTDQDASLAALNEFRKLVREDKALGPEWKDTIIRLVADGFPDDLSIIDEFLREDRNVTTKAIES